MTIIIGMIMYCPALSEAATAIFLPQNKGSTSHMEWQAKPQMVSSHRTEILILLVIVDKY